MEQLNVTTVTDNPTCKGCRNRDRMIKQLAERVDELERTRAATIRVSADLALEAFISGLLKNANET